MKKVTILLFIIAIYTIMPFRSLAEDNPPSVDILINASDSFVPLFYKGRTLPTEGSQIKAVAVSSAKIDNNWLEQENFSYIWNLDFNRIAFGLGNNFAVFNESVLNNAQTIQVTASAPSLGSQLTKSSVIAPVQPKIIFYEKDPILGINYENAIGDSLKLNRGQEITLIAVPYFLSQKNSTTFHWTINGEPIPDINGAEISLKANPDEGSVVLSVEIKKGNSSVGIKKSINISY